MKKLILLLLTFGILFASSIKAETVLYCQSEFATGLIKKSGSWQVTSFERDRFTIKFNQGYTLLEGLTYTPMTCDAPYESIDIPERIFCVDEKYSRSTLRYNKVTKRFVHYFQPSSGYIGGSDDTDILYAGSCKVF